MAADYKGNKHIPYQTDLDGDIAATTPNEPIVVPVDKADGDLKNAVTDTKY